MTEDRKNAEQQDVEAHMPRVSRWGATEEPQDVQAHGRNAKARAEDTPPAKPGTEGRDDDVEGHQVRSGR